jgi:hypothetical protein
MKYLVVSDAYELKVLLSGAVGDYSSQRVCKSRAIRIIEVSSRLLTKNNKM